MKRLLWREKDNHSTIYGCRGLSACFTRVALFILSSSPDLNKTAGGNIFSLLTAGHRSGRIPSAGVCRGLKGALFTRSSPPREENHSCRRGPILCPCRSLRHSAHSGGPLTLLPPCRIVRRSDLPPPTSRRPSGICSSKAAMLYCPSSPHVCMCIFFYSHQLFQSHLNF